jgi:hypothetical protein
MKINWPLTISTGIIAILILSTTGSAQSSSELEYMISLYLNAFEKAFGKLNQAQSQNITQIVTSFLFNGDRDFRKLNYILATSWHESRLQLVVEKRAAPGSDAYAKQEKYWYTGFYGRGLAQLTHEDNYRKMGKRLNIDLVNNPDLALDKRYSADILVIGMMEGIFTGVGLGNYINRSTEDYFNARKVVNGVDRAQLIADYTSKINNNLEFQIA